MGLAPVRQRLRNRLSRVLRDRIVGDDLGPGSRSLVKRQAPEGFAEFWGGSGPRQFSPEDPIWRVHADSSTLIAGIRALLLQSLHPLAMAGVSQHSGYRGDPWGRLQRTSHYIAVTTFAPRAEADRALARIRGIHRRVVGQSDDGRPYRADDPHLLGWVHAAQIESFLVAYQHFSPSPLTPREADDYVRQCASVNVRLGLVDGPESVAALSDALAGYRPELRATAGTADVVDLLLRHPPVSGVGRPAYRLLAGGAIATLPDWARTELGLPPGTRFGLVGARRAAAVARWAMTNPEVPTRSGLAAAALRREDLTRR